MGVVGSISCGLNIAVGVGSTRVGGAVGAGSAEISGAVGVGSMVVSGALPSASTRGCRLGCVRSTGLVGAVVSSS